MNSGQAKLIGKVEDINKAFEIYEKYIGT